MQFSHSVSLVLAAATRSVMKVGHLWGHSCLRTATRMAFSLVMYALSRRKTASSADIWSQAAGVHSVQRGVRATGPGALGGSCRARALITTDAM